MAAGAVHEAERLQADLRRDRIEPFARVINHSLLASATQDAVLLQRGVREAPFIERVSMLSASRCALIPWQIRAPVGAAARQALIQDSTCSRAGSSTR